jgi:hypothetical protein
MARLLMRSHGFDFILVEERRGEGREYIVPPQ